MESQEINFMLKLIYFLTILRRGRSQGLDQTFWGHDKELKTPELVFQADRETGYGHKPQY